jgi:hypothetical protein
MVESRKCLHQHVVMYLAKMSQKMNLFNCVKLCQPLILSAMPSSTHPSTPRRAPRLSGGAQPISLSSSTNDDVHHFPIHRPTSSIHSLLADDALAHRRALPSCIDIYHVHARATSGIIHIDDASRPKPLPLAYNPKRRTAPDMVLVPLSLDEIQMYSNYRGQGVKRLVAKRKRAPSDEPDTADTRTAKRHTGDVGVVVQHCQSIYRYSFDCSSIYRLDRQLTPRRRRRAAHGIPYHRSQGIQQLGKVRPHHPFRTSHSSEEHSCQAKEQKRQDPRHGVW